MKLSTTLIDLAPRFKRSSQGVWELKLDQPIRDLRSGTLTVSVKDKQGNVNRIERTFTISASKPLPSSR